MRFSLLRTLAFLPLALSLATSASAQFVGPGAAEAPTTVQAVLDNPQDDQTVTLRGVLLEKLSHEKYAFSDDSGQIRVEIDAEVFPPQRITPDTLIEIYGEIEKDFLRDPEIDVERLTVVEPAPNA